MYRPCNADGCDRIIRGDSVYCLMHRRRFAKHGDANFVHPKTLPLKERFRIKYEVCEETGCWNWIGGINPSGYGHMSQTEFGTLAHRISYGLHVGEIPKGDGPHGTCVLHKCDNRRCVNPDHLFLGSNHDNMIDRDDKGRQVASPGSANGNSKLTEKEVMDIRASYRPGSVTLKQLSDKYGVSTTTICDIVNERIWKHVL